MLLGIEDLLLDGVGARKVEGDLVGGQFLVDLSDGVQLARNLFSVQGVNEHLHVLLSVKSHASRLACDRGWVTL